MKELLNDVDLTDGFTIVVTGNSSEDVERISQILEKNYKVLGISNKDKLASMTEGFTCDVPAVFAIADDAEQAQLLCRQCADLFASAYLTVISKCGEAKIRDKAYESGANSVLSIKSSKETILNSARNAVRLKPQSANAKNKKISERLLGLKYEMLGIIDVETRKIRFIKMADIDQGVSGEHSEFNYAMSLHRFAELNISLSERAEAECSMSLDNIQRSLNEKRRVFDCWFLVDSKDGWAGKCCEFMYLDDANRKILVVRTDVTMLFECRKRFRDEIELLKSQSERAKQMQRSFIADASNALRTPLSTVLGLANLALDSSDLAEKNKYLKSVCSCGRILVEDVSNLLDMSRIEAGEVYVEAKPVYFLRLMREIADIVKPLCNKKCLEFVFDDANTENAYVLADSQKLQRILLNLLSNSVKYTPKYGRVQFTAECISRDEKFVHARFAVKDNGIGMSAGYQNRVFEPFSQENSDNRRYTGAGLGLVIVKKLVDLMGGRLEIRSLKNVGTECVVLLDFAVSPEENEKQPGTVKHMVLPGKRILLCEDHPINREISVKLLEKAGCIVDSAKNGAEGVKKFSKSSDGYYDAVVTDIRMPVMDGLDEARMIRRLDRKDASKVPIIALSANAFTKDAELSKAAGINAHLPKPIDPNRLYHVLLSQLSEK